MLENLPMSSSYEKTSLLGFGIGTELMPGINYYYEVNLKNELIEVYENNSFEIMDFSISKVDKIKEYEIGVNAK